MSKRLKKRVIYIFLTALFFVLMYGVGYYLGYSVFEDNIIRKDVIDEINPVVGEVSKNDDKIYVNNSLTYIVEKINVTTGEKETINGNVPVNIIGMTRDELIEYIGTNKDSFAEKNEIIESVMLLTFNDSRIVLREYYDVEEETTTIEIIDYKFIMKLENNEIAVYKIDDNFLFLKTKVNMEALDSDSTNRLTEGIKVRNISELYRMLESFTT